MRLQDIGTHSKPLLSNDRDVIVHELCSESRVFEYIPGRQHKLFSGIKPNIADSIDKAKLIALLKKKATLQKKITLVKVFGHNL